MPECPHCGKWFRTKAGLKQHITKAHTMDIGGVRMLDPSTFDPLGAAERRAQRRRKRKKGPFDFF